MLDFATIDNGYGFETAVRMDSDTARRFRRCELFRPGIVKQQERTDMVPVHGM